MSVLKGVVTTPSTSSGYPTVLPAAGIVTVASSPYSITSSDVLLLVDTSIPIQINLPDPSLKRIFKIVDISGLTTTNNITLHRFASEKILGLAADKLLATNWGSWEIKADGTNWWM